MLGISHVFTGCHPLDLTRVGHLVRADAIAMLKLAIVQICYSSKIDMWVWAHVYATLINKLRKAHRVKDQELGVLALVKSQSA